MDQQLSTALFRIFQEALTNIIRHAGASRVEIGLTKAATKLEMWVCDDGRGIDEAHLRKANSFGLIGIQERVRDFYGEFRIRGGRDGGTCVEVTIPVSRTEEPTA